MIRPAFCMSHGHCRKAVVWMIILNRDGLEKAYGFCAGCKRNARRSVVATRARWEP